MSAIPDFPWPQRKKGIPAMLAHRGGTMEKEAENTRQAFDQAIALGADGLETDIHATADGVLVVSHDPLLHTQNGDYLIATSTWDEIAGQKMLNGESPLTYAEFIDRYPDIYLNVDMKHDGAVQPLITLLSGRSQSDLNRMAYGSFSEDRLKVLRESFGNRIAYLAGPRTLLKLVFAAELAYGPAILGSWRQQFGRLALAIPEHYGPKALITPRVVAFAHRYQLPIYVWTINDVAEMQRLSASGVDGIFTDNLANFMQMS